MNHYIPSALLLVGLASCVPVRNTYLTSFTTNSGAIYHKGDTVRLGIGKADNGNFTRAYLPNNLLIGSWPKHLTPAYNGRSARIKRIRQYVFLRGMAPRTVAVIITPLGKAIINLELAEAAGELIPPKH